MSAPVVPPSPFLILTGQPWLPSVVDLLRRAREALTENQKHFLLAKPDAYFSRLLAGEGGLLVGGLSPSGALAGMSALVLFDTVQVAQTARAITCPAFPVVAGKVAVVQSFCTHPEFRRRDIALGVLQKAKELAPHRALFAQVSQDNACGRKKFDSAGFEEVGFWTEPDVQGLLREKVLVRFTPSAVP
ncbi:MAG: GNAT family N-acetyltransferase [Bdellovibrionales bacterium]